MSSREQEELLAGKNSQQIAMIGLKTMESKVPSSHELFTDSKDE